MAEEGKAIFEGTGTSFQYRYPPAGVAIKIRSPKIHSDGRLTALLRFSSDSGLIIPGSGLINLSAPRTRASLARDLEEARPTGVWLHLLDDLYNRLETRLLEGEPARLIYPDAECLDPPYLVEPLLPLDMPTVFYGAGGVGKGWLALLVAKAIITGESPRGLNLTVRQTGPVLYLDWESCYEDLHSRWTRVSADRLNGSLIYRRCAGPLANDVEYIQGLILETNPVLVIVDSAGLAAGGDLNSVESATELYRAVRELGRTTLIIAHSPKHGNSIFGSVYFWNLARMVWEVKAEPKDNENELVIGVSCGKSNIGPRHKPFGILLRFEGNRLETYPAELQKTFGLAELEGTTKRILYFLRHEGKATVDEIADSLGVARKTVQNHLYDLRRLKAVMKFPDGKWGMLVEEEAPF